MRRANRLLHHRERDAEGRDACVGGAQALRFAAWAPTVLEIGHYAYLKRKGNWSESTLLKSIEDRRASNLSIHGDHPSVVQASPDPARARPFAVPFTFANVEAAPLGRWGFTEPIHGQRDVRDVAAQRMSDGFFPPVPLVEASPIGRYERCAAAAERAYAASCAVRGVPYRYGKEI